MAEMNFAEMKMFGKYYGDRNLLDNDMFWLDCLLAYSDKAITLPLADCPATRRMLHSLLKCPAGECGACCHYGRVDLSNDDIKRLASHDPHISVDTKGCYLDCSKGCQFLVDGACAAYDDRPDICYEFPFQAPVESITADGKRALRVVYRLKCKPALEVIRTAFRYAMTPQSLLLPDLTVVEIPQVSIPLIQEEVSIEEDNVDRI